MSVCTFKEELVVAITVTQVNIAKGAMMSYEIFGYKDNICHKTVGRRKSI